MSGNNVINKLVVDIMKNFSGDGVSRESKYLLFNKIIGFKGAVEGIGTSTIVANTALALANKGLSVCVVDTSILYPVQRHYLKSSDDSNNDWFDLAFNSDKVFEVSKFNDNISVLSFKNRTIVDMLSSKDTEELVIVTYRALSKIFDVILVDICHESTNICASAVVQAHVVYQVWSNDIYCLSSIDKFIQNMVTCSCPLDKLRNVIISKCIPDVKTDWKSLLAKYKFTEVTRLPLSVEIARIAATNARVFGASSFNAEVDSFCRNIEDIVECIVGSAVQTGNISGMDIVTGKVEGTVEKQLTNLDNEVDQLVAKDMKNVLNEIGVSDVTSASTGGESENEVKPKKKFLGLFGKG